MQWTLEDKFDSGQEMYRFEVDVPPRGRDTFMINFLTMKVRVPRAECFQKDFLKLDLFV